MRSVEGSLLRVERGAVGAHLSTGKLRQEMLTLARQVTGVHPIVSQFGGLLTDFAVGGPIGLAVIGGITAIIAVFGALGRDARASKKETDDLIASLEKAIHLKSLGPGGETVDQVTAAKARADDLKREIARLEAIRNGPTPTGGPMIQQADARAKEEAARRLNVLYVQRQSILNTLAGGESIVAEAIRDAVDKEAPKIKDLSAGFMELQNAAEKVNAELMQEKRDWWKNYIESTGRAITITQQLAEAARAARPDLLEAVQAMLPETPGPADISASVRMAGDQAREINDTATKNAQDLKDAIWGSAIQGAQIIVSALNIGGGGKGSGLGGALGGTAGFAAGFALGGPIGGAIGSTLGTIGGSLIGGLFDHKKAVDANTMALNRVANLLNAPSGFKGAYYTYQAEDARRMYQQQQETARREATRGGNTGFTLRAGA